MKTTRRLHTILAIMLFALATVFAADSFSVEAQARSCQHKYKVVRIKKATSKKKGYKLYKCTKCGKTKKKTIAKLTKKTTKKASKVASASSTKAIETPVGGNINACYDTTDKAYSINGQTVVGHFDAQMSNELITMLNQYRLSSGQAALQVSQVLTQAAVTRAAETSVSFSHTRPNGSSCFTVSQYAAGENLAAGYRTAQSFMTAWKNSAGHNENMLRSEFKAVGIAVFAQQITKYGRTYYTYYAVQIFGR